MSDENREDEFGRPEADGDLGIPIEPVSDYPDLEPASPEPLEESHDTPELHSVNVPPLDEDFDDLPHEEPHEDYLEPLNPWIAVLYKPREALRYVLATGTWDNWFLVFTIFFALSMAPSILSGLIPQPPPPEWMVEFIEEISGQPYTHQSYPAQLVFLIIGTVFLAGFAYPLNLLLLYIMGWLYKVVGVMFGGVGTSIELRVALAWSQAFQAYTSVVFGLIGMAMSVVAMVSLDAYAALSIGYLVFMLFLLLPMFVYFFVLKSQLVGEAHQFSAWLGFATVLVCMIIAVFVFITAMFSFFFVLGMIIGLLS